MTEEIIVPFEYVFTVSDGSTEKVTVSLLTNGFLKITDSGRGYAMTHLVQFRDGKWMRVEGEATIGAVIPKVHLI